MQEREEEAPAPYGFVPFGSAPNSAPPILLAQQQVQGAPPVMMLMTAAATQSGAEFAPQRLPSPPSAPAPAQQQARFGAPIFFQGSSPSPGEQNKRVARNVCLFF